jgi:hypothetical protein
MERWEVVERCMLVAVGVALLGGCAWLVFVRTGPERFAALALLAPCTYWVFWQAFFEDKLKSREPPTEAERAMWAVWLWSRRVVLGVVALLFGAGALHFFTNGSIVPAAVSLCLALMSAWVAAYGGGRHKSMADDRAVHEERKRRYE